MYAKAEPWTKSMIRITMLLNTWKKLEVTVNMLQTNTWKEKKRKDRSMGPSWLLCFVWKVRIPKCVQATHSHTHKTMSDFYRVMPSVHINLVRSTREITRIPKTPRHTTHPLYFLGGIFTLSSINNAHLSLSQMSQLITLAVFPSKCKLDAFSSTGLERIN